VSKLHHILSTKQFLNKELLDTIFGIADQFQKQDKKNKLKKTLAGKLLASVFYEPSTRTRFSFEAAMLKLGGEVLSTESAGHFSSAIKGESLEDTIRVIGGYANAIVLRHHEEGAAERASRVSPVPIINAGDGPGEHPTQALLDFYTIKRELGPHHNLKLGLVGDLLYGRTVHSLIQLLPLIRRVKVFLISPKGLALPPIYKAILRNHEIPFFETADLERNLSEIDVLYMTRIQKERFPKNFPYQKVSTAFVLNKKILSKIRPQTIIMHPLPRNHEVHPEIDFDHRAAYFRQAQNGLYLRMALLQIILA